MICPAAQAGVPAAIEPPAAGILALKAVVAMVGVTVQALLPQESIPDPVPTEPNHVLVLEFSPLLIQVSSAP